MSYRNDPVDSYPTRAVNLQHYLLLHAQHEDLLSRLASLPTHKRRPSQPANFCEPSTVTSADTLSSISMERELYDVNRQIKTTLTELLNCESVKADRLYRAWVQKRLMEAERELKQGRRQSVTAVGLGERYVGDMQDMFVERVRV